MPSDWIEPELFMQHGRFNVFHTYRHDDLQGGTRDYWYALDESSGEEGDCTFDVREVLQDLCRDYGAEVTAAAQQLHPEDHEAIIRLAIDVHMFDDYFSDWDAPLLDAPPVHTGLVVEFLYALKDRTWILLPHVVPYKDVATLDPSDKSLLTWLKRQDPWVKPELVAYTGVFSKKECYVSEEETQAQAAEGPQAEATKAAGADRT